MNPGNTELNVKGAADYADNCFSWSRLPDIPVLHGISGAFTGLSNGALIIAGGSNFDRPSWEGGVKNYEDNIYVLERTGNDDYHWYQAGKLPFKVAHGAAVTIPEGVLCLGGTDGKKDLNKVFLLRWQSAEKKISIDTGFSPLPQACSYLSATRIGDHVYVAGGKMMEDNKEAEMNNFWTLRLKQDNKDSWEKLVPWPGPARFGATLVAQRKGRETYLYLCSGKSGSLYLKDNYEYDPRSSGWTKKADMPRAALLAPAIPTGDNYILIFTGSDGHDVDNIQQLKYNYNYVNDILAYDTKQDAWKTTGFIPTGLANASAIKWENKIVIPGGEIHPSVRTREIQAAEIGNLP